MPKRKLTLHDRNPNIAALRTLLMAEAVRLEEEMTTLKRNIDTPGTLAFMSTELPAITAARAMHAGLVEERDAVNQCADLLTDMLTSAGPT